MFDDVPFVLTNEPARRAPLQFENDERRQKPLFAGLDCLPGQDDLFSTEGADDDDRVE
jgi:hypothetical protein